MNKNNASSCFGAIAECYHRVPPSQATLERADQLLELNRIGAVDEAFRLELEQFEMAESLMTLLKARIRAPGFPS